MSEQFSHYKPRDHWDQVEYRWVMFDNVMPDEVLLEMMSPVEPVDLQRGAVTSLVGFMSTFTFADDLLNKVRAWEKEFGEPIKQAMYDRKAELSRQRFEIYYLYRIYDSWSGFANAMKGSDISD